MKLHFWKKRIQKIFGNRIHLDYAAATPVHKDILKAMRPFWNKKWANPSAIYMEGVEARKIIDKSRETLARVLHVRSTGVTFTSGGTESNNLALHGVIRALMSNGAQFSDFEIITTRIEHPSIQESVRHLSDLGVIIRYVPIDEDGMICINEFKELLSNKTALVSFSYVNSETGVVQDIKKISRIVKKWNELNNTSILVHTDACQAPLWLSCALDSLGVDLISLDSGKCYGPKSAGILAHKHGVNILSTMFGGSQEGGLRAGTESVALVVGCALSIERAQKHYISRSNSVSAIRDYGLRLLTEEIPDVVLNGSSSSRVANNINISILGLDTEYAVIVLDKEGIAVSTKSACGARRGVGSHVIREMTQNELRANSTLRFTFGEESKKSDIRRACTVLKAHITHMRKVL